MPVLIVIIILNIILMVAVLYFGTRENEHEVNLESASVVAWRERAQKATEARDAAASAAEAEESES